MRWIDWVLQNRRRAACQTISGRFTPLPASGQARSAISRASSSTPFAGRMRNCAWQERRRALQLSDRESGNRPNREKYRRQVFESHGRTPEHSADRFRSGVRRHPLSVGIWPRCDLPPPAVHKTIRHRRYRQAQLAGRRPSTEPFLGQFGFRNLPRNGILGRAVRLVQSFVQKVAMPPRRRNRLRRAFERRPNHVDQPHALFGGHRDNFGLGQSRHVGIVRRNRFVCPHFFLGNAAVRMPRNSSHWASESALATSICTVFEG